MINFSYVVLFHNNNSTDCVIETILEQSIDGDETILVNDHSDNDNLRMFDRFLDRIKIVHTDRKGNRGYNRNFGATYAQNEYILFVDGDIIFLPNAILAMRESMMRGNIGAVGNVICSNNTIPQMNLITGIDYLNMVQTEVTWEKLINLGLYYDQRQSSLFDKISLNTVWEYFYSGYCAVKRETFNKIGGFETNFVGWGVEDDELGYRLHLEGKLEYNQSAYGVHVPHMRNLYQCLISNRINLYRFLAKFPSNLIELHIVYGHTVKMHQVIDYIKDQIISFHTRLFEFKNIENCICVNELTSEFPNGYIRFADNKSNPHILELYGIALPFKNKNFNIAFCTENLFIYPEPFVAAILSEMLRVARKIHIIKVENPMRINWDVEMTNGFSRVSAARRIIYSSTRICDFDITEFEKYYQITDGIASKLNEHFVIPENFYHPELFNKEMTQYILVNLTSKDMLADEICSLEKEYDIVICNCYNVTVNIPHRDIRLSHILYGDFYRIHTSMIYVIPEGHDIIKDDKWWNYSFRAKDIVVQK